MAPSILIPKKKYEPHIISWSNYNYLYVVIVYLYVSLHYIY